MLAIDGINYDLIRYCSYLVKLTEMTALINVLILMRDISFSQKTISIDCTESLIIKIFTSPFSIALNVVGSNATLDKTLFDPQIVGLGLGVFCVSFMFDCIVVCDTVT